MTAPEGRIPRPVPPAFAVRTVALAPGQAMAYVEDDWRDAIVVVERGEVEIECRAGGARRFASGSLLWLTGLQLKSLHNRGDEDLLLSAIARLPATAHDPSDHQEPEPA